MIPIDLFTSDYITMYLGTIALIFSSVIVIWTSVTITNFRKFTRERDRVYTQRLAGMEDIIKKDLKTILELLKKP